MSAKSLTKEMKSALRTKLDGGTTEFRLDTLGGLTVRELIDSEGSLTTAGWNHAVAAWPLQEQCAYLGIGYERLEGLPYKGQQAPVVILVDLDETLERNDWATGVLYCAMTRATVRLELVVKKDCPWIDVFRENLDDG